MKNTKNKKGFTLVELIIVITILAILATIAFISFQSYTAQSRDAKVQSELGGARNAIEAELAKNSSILLSLASDDTSRLTTLDLGGKTSVATTTNYKAGKLNTTLLGGVKFDNDYRVGVTNVIGDNYQLAGTLTDGGNKAYVIGNYNARKITDTATGTLNTTTNEITLTSGLGLFKIGDTVKGTGGSAIIKSISSDLTKLTLSGSTITGGTSFTLNVAESTGLIGAKGALGTAVTNGGTSLAY